MAINFPDSPTLNQSFTSSGKTWIWDGSSWDSAPVDFDIQVADITDLTATATQINYLGGASPVSSSVQPQIDGKAPTVHTHNASAINYTVEDKTANYTIVAADEGKVIRSTNAAITITIADVFAVGEVVTFTQYGTGQITFVPNGGVTLHSVDTKRKTNKQYSTVQVMKTAAATYLLFGDIAA